MGTLMIGHPAMAAGVVTQLDTAPACPPTARSLFQAGP